jgi:hypothetical protein
MRPTLKLLDNALADRIVFEARAVHRGLPANSADKNRSPAAT